MAEVRIEQDYRVFAILKSFFICLCVMLCFQKKEKNNPEKCIYVDDEIYGDYGSLQAVCVLCSGGGAVLLGFHKTCSGRVFVCNTSAETAVAV